MKLLDVPEANWILGGGLAALVIGLGIYTAVVMLNGEPRGTPERA
jgi:Flp pilus assembly protein protease CpaA